MGDRTPALLPTSGREVDRDVLPGNSKSELRIAVRTRSRLSRTLVSGRPTTVNDAGRRDVDLDAHDASVNPGERGAQQRGEHDPHVCKQESTSDPRFPGDSGGGRIPDRSFCNGRSRQSMQKLRCATHGGGISSSRASRVDRQAIAGHQPVALQRVPRPQRGHRRAEEPGYRRQRVARLTRYVIRFISTDVSPPALATPLPGSGAAGPRSSQRFGPVGPCRQEGGRARGRPGAGPLHAAFVLSSSLRRDRPPHLQFVRHDCSVSPFRTVCTGAR